MPEPTHRPYAVVVGLDCITGLQTARILSGRDVPVAGVAAQPDHPAVRTRVCTHKVVSPTSGPPLVETLVGLGPRLVDAAAGKSVLFPCTDASVLTISEARDTLAPWFHVDLPPHELVTRLMDKLSLWELAAEHDWPIPRTLILRGPQDAARAAAELEFPCIVKPPIKTARWEQHTQTKAFKVFDAAELAATYARASAWSDVLVAQEWIEGSDATLYSFNGYFDPQSRPLVTFIARKLRQWPPHTGTSCLGEECRDETVLREAIRLFTTVGYRGLAYLEMKRDPRTGRYYIIEPNIGRPTGRSAIAEAGGVPLLYTAYCANAGRALPADREQQYRGVKWIYWRQDVRSATYYWRRGELSLRDWWRSWHGRKACAVFSWMDPIPFVADLFRLSGRALGRRRPAAAPSREPARIVTDESTV